MCYNMWHIYYISIKMLLKNKRMQTYFNANGKLKIITILVMSKAGNLQSFS